MEPHKYYYPPGTEFNRPYLQWGLICEYRSTPLVKYLIITYFSGIGWIFHLSRKVMYTICVRTHYVLSGVTYFFLKFWGVFYMRSRPVSGGMYVRAWLEWQGRLRRYVFVIGYMHNNEMCTESTHSSYLLLPNLVVGCSWTASDGVKDHSSAWKVMKMIFLYNVWPNHVCISPSTEWVYDIIMTLCTWPIVNVSWYGLIAVKPY